MSKSALSPRELALAIGASESSVKRWADDGHIAIAKTAGGHRRIPLADAIRFIRDRRLVLERPEILGLGELSAAATREVATSPAEQLRTFLVEGKGPEVRGLILSWYLAGQSIAAIGDECLRPAFEAIGSMWLHSSDGIFVEHRATELCLAALHQLSAILPTNDRGPVALGGAFAGDMSLLPTTLVSMVLTEHGFRTQNLGARMPVESLAHAIAREKPTLVWFSANHIDDPRTFDRELVALTSMLERFDLMAIGGGRALSGLANPLSPRLRIARTLTELAAWVDGWNQRAATP
jgi:excisionase family DNA binding protein